MLHLYFKDAGLLWVALPMNMQNVYKKWNELAEYYK